MQTLRVQKLVVIREVFTENTDEGRCNDIIHRLDELRTQSNNNNSYIL